jgi:aspartyl-tRNA(Asn)/glutamyl-tRNA(Gln) amidotransferase subunit C
MALERTEVEKIAHLARLGLSEADLPRTTETLNNILGLIDRMQAVDTTGIEPRASSTGRPAPIAAAIGSSIRNTSRAPAPRADSRMARRST